LKALDEPENLLYFDNGSRLFGEVLSGDNSAVTFRTWPPDEKTIKMGNKEFFRIVRNVPAPENPNYKRWFKSIQPGFESACYASLMFLAKHQDTPDGPWRVKDFDIGATALALLSYMGKDQPYRIGIHKKTVLQGLIFLKLNQNPDGSFNTKGPFKPIEHLIATLALAELCAITREQKFKTIALSALKMTLQIQNSDGGWPVKEGEPSTATGTAFGVLAMKAAKTSGLGVPEQRFNLARNWFDKATSPEGTVSAVLPGASRSATILSSAWGRLGMACISRIYCGVQKDDDKTLAFIAKLAKELPASRPDRPSYYLDVYFNTLTMQQMGGKPWDKWNRSLKEALLKTQGRGGCQNGSWNPSDDEHVFGGRIAATTLGSLALEIYYRYARKKCYRFKPDEPKEKDKGKLDEVSHLKTEPPVLEIRFAELIDIYNPKYLAAAFDWASWDERTKILFLLGTKWADKLPPEIVFFIKNAMKDKDAFVRANAVRALGNVGAKDARVLIEELKDDPSPFVREMVKDALGKM
jgi:hypothetical protein